MPSELLRPTVRRDQLSHRSIWKTYNNFSASKVDFPLAGLVFYAPLWFQGFSGSSFEAWDVANGSTHSCAVTGAVWGYQGRTHAGGDDYITITNVLASLAATTVGTWEAWLKVDDATPAASNRIISFGDTNAVEWISLSCESGGTVHADCYDAGVGAWAFDTNAAQFSDNVFLHVALVHNGTAPVLYVNGSLVAITFSVSTNKTKWFSVCTGLDNGFLGKLSMNNTPLQSPLYGVMGEARLYNKALSAAEVMRNYMVTKWRFS